MNIKAVRLLSQAWFREVEGVAAQVHQLPAYPIVYRASRAKSYLGKYEDNSSAPDVLRVSVNSPTPYLTFFHETGHRVDRRGLSDSAVNEPEDLASWGMSAELREWRIAVRNSSAIADLEATYRTTNRPDIERIIEYYMQPHELWARTYVQYIAVKSQYPPLLAELRDSQRAAVAGRKLDSQWQDQDFIPIMDAIDVLFGRKGWRT